MVKKEDNTFPGSGPIVIKYEKPTEIIHCCTKTKTEKYQAISTKLRNSKKMRNPKSYIKKSGDKS